MMNMLLRYLKVGIIFMILIAELIFGINLYHKNKEAEVIDTKKVKETEWNLVLVNKWNPIEDDYPVVLKQLTNGHSVDERCYDALLDMIDDCKKEGLVPVICSSYRSIEYQTTLYNNKVNRLIAQGYTKKEAKNIAQASIAPPKTSEHHLGLAVDIVDINNQNLDESQQDTLVQRWLMENSWKYGFVLRYPQEKSDITGIIYEPWHYRYVGKSAAKIMNERNLCLEEYLNEINAIHVSE